MRQRAEISTHDERPLSHRRVKNTAGLTLQRAGLLRRQHAPTRRDRQGNYVIVSVPAIYYTTTCQDESCTADTSVRATWWRTRADARRFRNHGTVTSSEKTLRDQELAPLRFGHYLEEQLRSDAGIYSIRLVVRDTEGQMMTARNGRPDSLKEMWS